jgi:hypothetical protein
MAHGNTKTIWKIVSHVRTNGKLEAHTAMVLSPVVGTEARKAFRLYRDLITYGCNYQNNYSHSELWRKSENKDWELALTITHNYFNKP